MSIRIFYDDVSFRLKKVRKIPGIVSDIITSEKKIPGNLNFIFNSDERLKKINVEFLEHDYYTDVITFNYNVENVINGEVYISIERVKENAVNYSVSLDSEILRVIIHGTLHLLGYDDPDEKSRMKMRVKENIWLDYIKERNYGFSL